MELLGRPGLAVLGTAMREIMSGRLSVGRPKDLIISVTDEQHCKVKLNLSNDSTYLTWHSDISESAVSAFHFHGSLDKSQFSNLENEKLFVGDLSATASVGDANTGSYSFQAGYEAMIKAMQVSELCAAADSKSVTE